MAGRGPGDPFVGMGEQGHREREPAQEVRPPGEPPHRHRGQNGFQAGPDLLRGRGLRQLLFDDRHREQVMGRDGRGGGLAHPEVLVLQLRDQRFDLPASSIQARPGFLESRQEFLVPRGSDRHPERQEEVPRALTGDDGSRQLRPLQPHDRSIGRGHRRFGGRPASGVADRGAEFVQLAPVAAAVEGFVVPEPDEEAGTLGTEDHAHAVAGGDPDVRFEAERRFMDAGVRSIQPGVPEAEGAMAALAGDCLDVEAVQSVLRSERPILPAPAALRPGGPRARQDRRDGQDQEPAPADPHAPRIPRGAARRLADLRLKGCRLRADGRQGIGHPKGEHTVGAEWRGEGRRRDRGARDRVDLIVQSTFAPGRARR
jgi:hypothetical protein